MPGRGDLRALGHPRVRTGPADKTGERETFLGWGFCAGGTQFRSGAAQPLRLHVWSKSGCWGGTKPVNAGMLGLALCAWAGCRGDAGIQQWMEATLTPKTCPSCGQVGQHHLCELGLPGGFPAQVSLWDVGQCPPCVCPAAAPSLSLAGGCLGPDLLPWAP